MTWERAHCEFQFTSILSRRDIRERKKKGEREREREKEKTFLLLGEENFSQ